MWADALDRMMARLARRGDRPRRTFAPSPAPRSSTAASTSIAAPPTSGARSIPRSRSRRSCKGTFSRDGRRSGWMRPRRQCREIEEALGGAERTPRSPARRRASGSPARRFASSSSSSPTPTPPPARDSSGQLVPRLAAGRRRRADRSGRRLRHEPDGPRAQSLVARSARRHRARLAASACRRSARRGTSSAGSSPYWQQRYALPPAAVVAVDRRQPVEPRRHRHHPRRRARRLARHERHRVHLHAREPAGQSSHVFRSPTGDFMNLVCFRNGSLAREWVRIEHGLDWDGVSAAARAVARQRRCADAAVARDRDHAARDARRPAAIRLRSPRRGAQRARGRRRPDDGDRQSRRGRSARPIDRVIATGGAAVNRGHPAGDGQRVRRGRLPARRRELGGARRRAARVSRRSPRRRRAGVVEDGGQRLHRAATRHHYASYAHYAISNSYVEPMYYAARASPGHGDYAQPSKACRSSTGFDRSVFSASDVRRANVVKLTDYFARRSETVRVLCRASAASSGSSAGSASPGSAASRGRSRCGARTTVPPLPVSVPSRKLPV